MDIGKVLHVTTIASWDVIAQWYSDLTREQSESSLNIEQEIKELFPKGTADQTDLQKARTIYQYVVTNIAYNAVPFMHSAYVPQKASKTLSTRLGDCKDVATLFVALARRVGLKANLVLVNTRDNGQYAMAMPSMEFNHCIVHLSADGTDYYLELTDKNLPFCALPSQLYGAQVLNIPLQNDIAKAGVVLLNPVKKLTDIRQRKMKITISGNDIEGNSIIDVTGALGADYRDQYKNESTTDVEESLKQKLTQSFKKPVDIEGIHWHGINQLSDTVRGDIQFSVKNEVIQLGDMNILKPNFIDVVASSDLFSVTKRNYPIEYWQYENTQQYETEMEIDIPSGKSFKDLPGDVTYDFNDMKYHLSYQKLNANKLLIKRTFVTQPWENIKTTDYTGFEDFFHKIIKAESRYISF